MVTREVVLEADNLKIAGQLYLPGGQTSYPTVCVCHGIPARPADPNDRGYPLLAKRICREGFVVLIFNFRGAGASEWNLDIFGWTKDLRVAIDYLYTLPEIDKAHLAVLGFSGGAAVSICVAARDKRISCVVACACPAEFGKVAEPQSLIAHFRNIGVIRDSDFPQSIEEWLNGFKWVKPIKYAGDIAPRPILLVHGSEDDVVDVSHAYRLYDKAREPKQLAIIEGAGHRLRLNEQAMDTVIGWLKSTCTDTTS